MTAWLFPIVNRRTTSPSALTLYLGISRKSACLEFSSFSSTWNNVKRLVSMWLKSIGKNSKTVNFFLDNYIYRHIVGFCIRGFGCAHMNILVCKLMSELKKKRVGGLHDCTWYSNKTFYLFLLILQYRFFCSWMLLLLKYTLNKGFEPLPFSAH